ncbi:MAG: DUF177 domain-containing protein [Bdellovibrionales bacterium]|nr:DUF177 domain-containing protein [Bdellovibrionales bacterium]
MRVYFHEIKDQELELRFDESTPWVMDVIGSLDERMDRIQRPPNWKPRSRPTRVDFTLRRVDDLIHVTGKVKSQLFLLCSLCADAFQFPIQTQFHVLLTQTPIYGETPRETSRKNTYDGTSEEQMGFEEDEDDEEETPAMNLNSSDFEVSVVNEPLADLREILNEQIILILPMQPKPPKNEAGDCLKCGRSQLSYHPEHQESLKENPFAVLKNMKPKKS